MTPIDLVDRLIEEIKVIVKDFHLDTNVPGVKKAPQVISGYLGEKKPFISHYVQIKHGFIRIGVVRGSTFISHYVQIKRPRSINRSPFSFTLYPTTFR